MTNTIATTLNALSGEDPSRAIAEIKTAVGNFLRQSDSAIAVEATNYFNHSFAPDLMLKWPDSAETQDRPLYLRTNAHSEVLADSLDWITLDRPIVMPLTGIIYGEDGQDGSMPDEEGSVDEVDAGPAAATGTERRLRQHLIGVGREVLVAPPDAFEHIGGASTREYEQLLARNFIRGGRGLVDRDRAADAARDFSAAFVAAQSLEGEATRQGVDSIESILAPQSSGVLTRLLQAVWVGSGGPSSTFPGGIGATGALDVDGLALLLEVADATDDQFWSRIGANASLNQICGLRVSEESRSFQQLVKFSLDRLEARSCAIVGADGDVDLSPETFRWSVSHGLLRMRTRNYSAAFSSLAMSSMPEQASGQASKAPAVTVDQVKARSRRAGRLVALELVSPSGSDVTLRVSGDADLVEDATLAQLSTGDDKSQTAVRTATIQVGSKQLRCNLSTGRAGSPTRGTFYLTQLMLAGVPMLQSLSAGEFDGLQELVAGVGSHADSRSDVDSDADSDADADVSAARDADADLDADAGGAGT